MSRVKTVALTLALALFLGPLVLGPLSRPAGSVTLGEKAALQAAMQLYIDQQTVDGAFFYLDRKTGEARSLHALTAHPMILASGPHFVLCADFRDTRGQDVNVDFYMARRGQSYVVFHVAAADHEWLDRQIAAGKVRKPD